MGRDEQRSTHLGQPRLERVRLRCRDSVVVGDAERHADDGVSRAERLSQLRARRPPFLDARLRRQAPLHHPPLQVAVGGKDEHLAAAALKRQEVLQVVGHDQVADPEHAGVGAAHGERGVGVQELARQLGVVQTVGVGEAVAQSDQLWTPDAKLRDEIRCCDAELSRRRRQPDGLSWVEHGRGPLPLGRIPDQDDDPLPVHPGACVVD